MVLLQTLLLILPHTSADFTVDLTVDSTGEITLIFIVPSTVDVIVDLIVEQIGGFTVPLMRALVNITFMFCFGLYCRLYCNFTQDLTVGFTMHVVVTLKYALKTD